MTPPRTRTYSTAALALGALLLLPASGCLAPKRVEPLGDAVLVFNDAVRWERFEMAAERLPPRQRDDFLDERDQLSEDLRITGYEVVRIRYDKTRRRAKVHIKYTWHRDSRGVVRTTHAVQRWERPGSTWVILREHHLRGTSMPGVAEAPEGPVEPTDDTEKPQEDLASGDGNLREPPR